MCIITYKSSIWLGIGEKVWGPSTQPRCQYHNNHMAYWQVTICLFLHKNQIIKLMLKLLKDPPSQSQDQIILKPLISNTMGASHYLPKERRGRALTICKMNIISSTMTRLVLDESSMCHHKQRTIEQGEAWYFSSLEAHFPS